ncbi:MAG: hypothetical protein IPK05_04680 [Comamonadaceae bacterium]|nr:hypothetical protein [Comamonadaceae bacterium]
MNSWYSDHSAGTMPFLYASHSRPFAPYQKGIALPQFLAMLVGMSNSFLIQFTDVNSDLLRVCQPQCENVPFEQGKVITFAGLLLDLSIARSHKFLKGGDDCLLGLRTVRDRPIF